MSDVYRDTGYPKKKVRLVFLAHYMGVRWPQIKNLKKTDPHLAYCFFEDSKNRMKNMV